MKLQPDIIIEHAAIQDVEKILMLQKIAYVSEAEIIDDHTIPPLHQTLDEIIAEFDDQIFLKVESNGKIIGSVRTFFKSGTCYINKLIVHPRQQNSGIGTRLLQAAEELFPDAERYELFTGQKSERNLYLYNKQGYEVFKSRVVSDKLTLVYLEKEKRKKSVESLEEKVARVLKDEVVVMPYNPCWPEMFERERLHLLACLPRYLIKRIEHFGSTAVPGLAAKPIVDILVEVSSLEDTRQIIAPILEAQGYDYFWRPTWGNDIPPFYAWFIKRGPNGDRTHHIHMVEAHFEHWDRLLFRNYLVEHPEVAREYSLLKKRLSEANHHDRVGYTEAKTDFIKKVTEKAKNYYSR